MNNATGEYREAINEIDRMIRSFDVAMLVTTSLDGGLRARPMAVAGHERGLQLYFLTRADDGKLDEIAQQPDVNVVMQGDGEYLSVTGRAGLGTRVVSSGSSSRWHGLEPSTQ